MAGLERWHKLRVQAARNRRSVTTAAQVERSTIPVRVNRDDEVVDVDVPIPELVQEGVRAGEEADFAKQIAADAAQVAQDAQTSADGKSRVVRSTSEATAAGSYKEGDQWWQFSGANIVGLWLHDGAGWVQQVVTSQVIASLDAGKITTGVLAADRIGTNSITTAKLSSTAIDGMTITGAVMRTASAGQRLQFDVNGLSAYNQSGVLVASLASGVGSMQLAGGLNATGSVAVTTTDNAFSSILARDLISNRQALANGSVVRSATTSASNGFQHTDSSTVPSGNNLTARADLISMERFRTYPTDRQGKAELSLYGSSEGGELVLERKETPTSQTRQFRVMCTSDRFGFFLDGSPTPVVELRPGGISAKFLGDTELLPWSSFGTYGTGWSDLTATPYQGVNAQVKGGMFYLDIALKKASGHVGSEVILRINQAYRPKGPKMQYGYASGDNFVVAQPDGDIIVAIARAGAGNLTAATLAWSLT